jgi:mRNA-degrading endonuclease toxin of MazEF toxin-antitoxin module
MPYKRGEVVLVLFPDSNLRTAKRRPALVIQADNLKHRPQADNSSHDHQQYVTS